MSAWWTADVIHTPVLYYIVIELAVRCTDLHRITRESVELKYSCSYTHTFHTYTLYMDVLPPSLFLPPSFSPPPQIKISCSQTQYREGDMYAALRDAESALALCPSYQKALRRRLRCLQHLSWNKVANHLLHKYAEQYPADNEFINRTQADLDLAIFQMCVCT